MQFFIKAIITCTPDNTQGFTYKLRRLDVCCFRFLNYILEDILQIVRNSKIDTFGHKIELIINIIVPVTADIGYNKRFNKNYGSMLHLSMI